MNKTFEKRLKRKRILETRVKCHGNKFSCDLGHVKKPSPVKVERPVRKSIPEAEFRKPFKKSWFKRIFSRKTI